MVTGLGCRVEYDIRLDDLLSSWPSLIRQAQLNALQMDSPTTLGGGGAGCWSLIVGNCCCWC